MGMQGFDREELQAPLAEINTTPLVDVMLVLLVIFLVTAPMLTQSIKLELPHEAASQIAEKALTISLDGNGQYYWDNAPVMEEALEQRFKETAASNPKQPIHLRADTNIPYGKVSRILALAQHHGLTNIGFITEPK